MLTRQSWMWCAIMMMLLACRDKTAQPAPRLNILFVISDDQSHVHTSFAGSTFVHTPAFDRIAREGVYFVNCLASSPGCAPARSSLVTGRHHWQNGISGQHGAAWHNDFVPFVDVLKTGGYRIGRTGKGVGPFYYGGDDPQYRQTDAAGPEHSIIRYGHEGHDDVRPTTLISDIDYFANFKHFMEEVRGDAPFFFWFGASEPHRAYETDSWQKHRKRLEDVQVPGFLPDHAVVRGDLLDYALEIEWFDLHLQQMLDYLEAIGELDHTLIVVTSDNGMPFPRAKANCYEYGIHVPLAIRHPETIGRGRVNEELISFIDFAPTFLDYARVPAEGMQPMRGRSLVPLLREQPERHRDKWQVAFSGRERHSSSRFENWGYPQRALRTPEHLLIWNLRPERWPAGDPQALLDNDQPGPRFGLNEQGIYQPGLAFADIDACPTVSLLVEYHSTDTISRYFRWAVDKRPEFELFEVQADPYNLINLADSPQHQVVFEQLRTILQQELLETADPRVTGSDPEIFDSYPRLTGPMRSFLPPHKAMGALDK